MTPANPDALARVTAERDEAREEAYDLKLAAAGGEDVPGSANLVTAEDVRRWRDEETRALAAAEARAAQLQAEVEAKDRAILLLFPFVDYAAVEGLMFVETEDGDHPEMDAADIMAATADALGLELCSDAYLSLLPDGYAAIRAARAATAREGEAEPPKADAPWPAGCIKPNSCARHKVCMYGLKDDSCRHRSRDIREEVAWAEAEKR